MKIIWKKIFVVLVSTLTFGLVTPSYAYDLDHSTIDKGKKPDSEETNKIDQSSDIICQDTPISKLVRQCNEMSYYKFGDRIGPVIKDEFQSIIFPKIEEVLYTLTEELGTDKVLQLKISEQPGKGTSEKMFHVIDTETNADLVRFHVRRDHPPGEGYWFNFHYHTYKDNFENHYDLGSIYWDTNTPPNWMSATKDNIFH
ncbi:MAG TPA: YpjP family protein [Bacillus sp. (in: firmicutes)]|uniref:YpjP family protein n=1 Tax=Bacillus litorisediminis TaxID=2922713 RepID=UPI001FAF9E01|nr:YpjP family protein [Bacillus litorisediminis]HWO76316.1 YpjP family protein [Bacillus sp. (in: firmicutes)]